MSEFDDITPRVRYIAVAEELVEQHQEWSEPLRCRFEQPEGRNLELWFQTVQFDDITFIRDGEPITLAEVQAGLKIGSTRYEPFKQKLTIVFE